MAKKSGQENQQESSEFSAELEQSSKEAVANSVAGEAQPVHANGNGAVSADASAAMDEIDIDDMLADALSDDALETAEEEVDDFMLSALMAMEVPMGAGDDEIEFDDEALAALTQLANDLEEERAGLEAVSAAMSGESALPVESDAETVEDEPISTEDDAIATLPLAEEAEASAEASAEAELAEEIEPEVEAVAVDAVEAEALPESIEALDAISAELEAEEDVDELEDAPQEINAERLVEELVFKDEIESTFETGRGVLPPPGVVIPEAFATEQDAAEEVAVESDAADALPTEDVVEQLPVAQTDEQPTEVLAADDETQDAIHDAETKTQRPCRLLIFNEGKGPRILEMKADVMVVGRHPDSEVMLLDKGVSREHVRLTREGEGWSIVDLNSTNGSFLGYSRLSRKFSVAWDKGVELRVGPFALTWEYVEERQAEVAEHTYIEPVSSEHAATANGVVAGVSADTGSNKIADAESLTAAEPVETLEPTAAENEMASDDAPSETLAHDELSPEIADAISDDELADVVESIAVDSDVAEVVAEDQADSNDEMPTAMVAETSAADDKAALESEEAADASIDASMDELIEADVIVEVEQEFEQDELDDVSELNEIAHAPAETTEPPDEVEPIDAAVAADEDEIAASVVMSEDDSAESAVEISAEEEDPLDADDLMAMLEEITRDSSATDAMAAISESSSEDNLSEDALTASLEPDAASDENTLEKIKEALETVDIGSSADMFDVVDLDAPHDPVIVPELDEFLFEAQVSDEQNAIQALQSQLDVGRNGLQEDTLAALIAQIDAGVVESPARSGARIVRRNYANRTAMVVFELGDTQYAVDVDFVLELSDIGRITPVPFVPEYVLGVTNLRGEILSVVDLRVLLGFEPKPVPIDHQMMIIELPNENMTVGVIVDDIRGYRQLESAESDEFAGQINEHVGPYVNKLYQFDGELVVEMLFDKVLDASRVV